MTSIITSLWASVRGFALRFSRSLLAVILSFMMVVPAPLMAQIPARQSRIPDLSLVANNFAYEKIFEGDPMWEQFVRAPWNNMPAYGPFERNDRIIDQDPYFMRSQGWVNAQSTREWRVRNVNNGIVIDIPGGRRSLQINQNLRPLFAHEDFYFFQATAQQFTSRGHTAAEPAQGLFFIDRRDLRAEASKRSGVIRSIPVFFLPMPYEGWAQGESEISGLHDVDLDEIHIRNSAGNSVSIEVLDIYKLSQLYHFNLTLTTSMALRHQTRALQTQLQQGWANRSETFELPNVLPPVGSTAVFGMYVTGLDLENPSRSISEIAQTPIEKLWRKFSFIDQAHASDLISPDVFERMIFIGQVLSAVYVTSVAAKYTFMRQRNLERRALIEANEDAARPRIHQQQIDRLNERIAEAQRRGRTGQVRRLTEQRDALVARGPRVPDRTSPFFQALREFREQIDFLSHGLATASTGVSITTGYALEFGADKFLGYQGQSPNGMVRKFLNYTFLYNRQQSENIAANWNTFFLGAVVLGGIDTAGVVVQLTAVSPVFFPWVAGAFGEEMQARVAHQFSGADAEANNNITSEIMRNFTGYTLSGAYSYSAEQRTALLEVIRPDVEAQMRREGKNPADATHHAELARRIETRLEAMLVERGLPGQAEFLFSAPSAIRALSQIMGYKVDRNALPTGERGRQFALENARWGVVNSSLKRAINAARELDARLNDPKTAAAVSILEETLSQHSIIRNILRNPHRPAHAIAQARKIRQQLAMLTYDGPIIGSGIQFADQWDAAKSNPQAAALAGMLFRQSFFGLTQDKPHYLQPNQEQLDRYLPQAREEAIQRLAQLHEQMRANGATPVASDAADREILALEIVKEKVDTAAQQASIAEYRPPRQDWLSKWQANRAHLRAVKIVAERLGANATLDLNSDQAARIYREAYREALSRIVGLRTQAADRSALVQRSVEQAEADLTNDMTGNEGLRLYMERLTQEEKAKFLAHRYADSFLSHYAENTVSNSNFVSLTSSEQPGRFQGLRQTKLVSGNGRLARFLRTTLRLAESPMDATTAFRPGFNAMLKRNIPLYQDTITQLSVKMRGITVAATTGYLGLHYIWQVRYDWPTYLFFFSTAGFVAVASNWLSRMMINVNIRPMHDIGSKVLYSSVYTWLTYPTFIPFFFFYEDFNAAFSKYITVPVLEAASQVGPACYNIFQHLPFVN